ncbi:MAG: hypothetical protein AABY22_32695 [Nanoarchaeota archaeon]
MKSQLISLLFAFIVMTISIMGFIAFKGMELFMTSKMILITGITISVLSLYLGFILFAREKRSKIWKLN